MSQASWSTFARTYVLAAAFFCLGSSAATAQTTSVAQVSGTVTDASGVAQPITTAPLIEIHPVTRKRYVLFGTGVLLAVTDVANSQMQSFYAIIDGTAVTFEKMSTKQEGSRKSST